MSQRFFDAENASPLAKAEFRVNSALERLETALARLPSPSAKPDPKIAEEIAKLKAENKQLEQALSNAKGEGEQRLHEMREEASQTISSVMDRIKSLLEPAA